MGASLFTLAQNGLISGLNATSPIESMKFGSLMSATDPVATLAVLGSLNVEPQLYCLVFGIKLSSPPLPPLPPLPQTLNPNFHALTQVSYADSLKISLALKKALVDEGLLDVTQADMEKWLFFIMRSKVRLIASPRSVL